MLKDNEAREFTNLGIILRNLNFLKHRFLIHSDYKSVYIRRE
jgi:hypothetical protein